MPTLKAIDIEQADSHTRELLAEIEKSLGMIPNYLRLMANSPVTLEAFLCFQRRLAKGRLPLKLQEQIALTVSEQIRCRYGVAVHAAVGQTVGMGSEEIEDCRQGTSPDRRVEAVLRMARSIVINQGHLAADEVAQLKRLGFRQGEIVEIIAQVSLTLFVDYLALMGATPIDAPYRRALEPTQERRA